MNVRTYAPAGLLRRALLASACLLWAVVPASASDGLSVLDRASALKAAGNFDGAISVLRAFIARGRSEDRLVLATAWNNLAAAYQDLGRCQESKTAYSRAFRLYEQAGDAALTVTGAMNYASALIDCGAPSQAAQLVRQALEPRMGALTPCLRARTLLLKVNEPLERRRWVEAESLYGDAASLLEGEEPTPVVLMLRAAALNGLALVFAGRGRKSDAIAETRRALALLEQAGRPAAPVKVKVLAHLAALYHDTKRHEEADVTYLAALSAASAAFGGEDNPATALILMEYSDHLRNSGRRSEAKDAHQRAQAILANTRPNGTVDIEDLRVESRRRR